MHKLKPSKQPLKKQLLLPRRELKMPKLKPLPLLPRLRRKLRNSRLNSLEKRQLKRLDMS